ncbi:hypothetical protein TanjilG_30626 [Lupinus angustifolius]|uniref:BHLH domain-containing protein n=1 Tax=Lupinus angustifolius TaxID=3871 RepID=A0A4P1RNI5_LUPAN|nr:hypothetical protein TanjilG_30626 [Lupinus angustifolius]
MDTIEAFSDGEWDCFHRMLFTTEEHDHLQQFLGQSSLQSGEDNGNIGIKSSIFCPTTESEGYESMFYSFDAHNSNLQHISQESSQSSDHNVLISDQGHTNYYLRYPDNVLANNAYASLGFSMTDEKNHVSLVPLVTDIVVEDNASLNARERNDVSVNFDHIQEEPIVFPNKQLQLKSKPDMLELEVHVEDKININSSCNQKKRSRASKDASRCAKNERSRKNQKVEKKNKVVEEINAGADGQSCSSYTSENDNAYQENNEGITSVSKSHASLNSNGKTRASRGSATDPQSLYARVDISTMLEEAIHYVKLLQLQIKLLSSDDLWMYAPIAYNGFDIGLDLNRKVSQPQ